MKKFLTILAMSSIALTTMTACAPSEPYTGEVIVKELDHVRFRPKMGNMPMQSEKFKVKVCPTPTETDTKCFTKRVSKEKFREITVGQILNVENNEIL